MWYNSCMKRGFTLIEMIVSIGIFGIIALLATTSLLSLSAANRAASVSRKAVDNLDFVMDDIIHEARLGNTYFTSNDGESDFSLVRLEDLSTVEYNTVTDPTTNITSITKSVDGGAATNLTAEGVNVNALHFYVFGGGTADGEPARVLISLQATLNEGTKYSTTFNLQTTVTQRASDD